MMFGRRDSKNMFKEIARLNGVSVREVKEQMRLGIEQARNNPDPEAQAEFTKYFGNRTPSPEEFIYTIANKINA